MTDERARSLYEAAFSACRFAGSRNAITAEEETAILAIMLDACKVRATPATVTGSDERAREVLEQARNVLEAYASPKGYVDAYGEEYDASDAVHPGVLAAETVLKIDAALAASRPTEAGAGSGGEVLEAASDLLARYRAHGGWFTNAPGICEAVDRLATALAVATDATGSKKVCEYCGCKLALAIGGIEHHASDCAVFPL